MSVLLRLLASLLGAALLLTQPNTEALAQIQAANKTIPVDLELVLAVDVSRSIDSEEFELQRQGYASALSNPKVLRAIQGGAIGAIALTYVEWSGVDQQRVIVPWTLVRSEDDFERVASDILAAPRAFAAYTSISAAIDLAVELFRTSPYEGARQVIDISGDGANNSGRAVEVARDAALAEGIVINGLPIMNDRGNPFGRPEPKLDDYYRDFVIGGPGAFVVPAESFVTFSDAILAKLIREITSLPSDGTTQYAALP
ncbi:MAG: DUF1194 domain-containing protein [Alphaproteobacteria bacterium]|nr:DUF1194 domain-containing protein [Alphaproteobacteria bacterium]TAD89249.1 MAG: DUF1194 domain-containing protein [Alphaproteobacteria bacterium]